jgi:Zn-dependent peptidase ImmA (M78 family)/DNA-binding XRE family transcriptional regulator
MATPQAHINPSMLRWARSRVGFNLQAAAKAAHVKPEQLERWEMGDDLPTFKQAQNVAHALHAPFGFFFLQQPPKEAPLLPDLRTVGGAPVEKPSVNLLETIQHTLQRQAWYADYQQDQGTQPLPFVGRFTANTAPRTVAADIRKVLRVDVEQGQRQWDVYQRELIQAAERAGILVMRSGIVGSNTRRKLDVGEFRGFAISHLTVPVVFINAADAPAARLFTLLHELAHIWLGSSGISNATPGSTHREEVACNAIAGEFLAPAEIFHQAWANASPDLAARLAELARRFHVSQLVVMRRALDLSLMDRETYNNFYLTELERFRQAESQGGSYYRNAGSKNSTRFAKAVIAEAFSGRLLLRDAGKLLGVQPANLRAFAEQLGT